MSSEYSNSTGGAGCAYANLGAYSGSYSMGIPAQGVVRQNMAYVVPSYGTMGYDTLTSKDPSCSGYPNIMSAYGSDAGSCNTQYTLSKCS